MTFTKKAQCALRLFEDHLIGNHIASDAGINVKAVFRPYTGTRTDICTLSVFEGESLGDVIFTVAENHEGKGRVWKILERSTYEYYIVALQDDASINVGDRCYVLRRGN